MPRSRSASACSSTRSRPSFADGWEGHTRVRELADEYTRADVWAREALAEQATPGWPRTLSVVEGAAFHIYARGAVDYAP